ncbi:peptidase inhibitor I78 family-domain-containing protein [Thermoascus aurantiacus ATCC 26904]
MPLVVPGINSSMGDKEEWLNKLVGKKITELTTDANSFARKDLPESHRIIRPGDMVTMDYRPERLNVHVDDNGTVRDVRFG